MYIMLPEVISTMYFINDYHQYYQQCSLANHVVLLTLLQICAKVLFLYIRSSNYNYRDVGDKFIPELLVILFSTYV
jgi:hypothetical protein